MQSGRILVGRVEERAQLSRLAESPGSVTLLGPPGIGKSALVEAVFEDALAVFPERVWRVEFSSDLAEDALPGLIARSVEARSTGIDPIVDVATRVGDAPALFILDCAESIGAAAVASVERLCGACAGLRFIVVARSGQAGAGSASLTLGPLDTGAEGPAVELFRQVAAGSPVGLREEWGSAQIQDVCMAVGGIPLAITLAASRSGVLTPDQLLNRLRERISSTSVTEDRLSEAIRAVMTWRYESAEPREREAWLNLSILDGAFTLECADHLLGFPSDEVLGELLGAGVLTRTYEPPGAFRMAEPARAFGARAAQSVRARQETRLLEYVVALAEESYSQVLTPRQADWATRAQVEHASVRTALGICLRRPELHESAVGILFRGFRGLWWAAGYGPEIAYWASRLAAAHPEDDLVSGYVLAALMGYPMLTEQRDDRMRRAAAIADASGSDSLRDLVDYAGSRAKAVAGDTAAALVMAARIVARHRDGRTGAYLDGLEALADAAYCGDDLDTTTSAAQAILDAVEPLGEYWYRSLALRILALVRSRTGSQDDAFAVAQRALEISVAGRASTPIVAALQTTAIIADRDGMPRLAAFLEGAVDARSDTVAASRAVLTASGDLPRLRAGLKEELGGVRYARLLDDGRHASIDEAVSRAAAGIELELLSIDAMLLLDSLTSRERQIAELVAKGVTNQAIADTLYLSRRTVESHVSRVLQKLGLERRSQLAAMLASSSTSGRSRSRADHGAGR